MQRETRERNVQAEREAQAVGNADVFVVLAGEDVGDHSGEQPFVPTTPHSQSVRRELICPSCGTPLTLSVPFSSGAQAATKRPTPKLGSASEKRVTLVPTRTLRASFDSNGAASGIPLTVPPNQPPRLLYCSPPALAKTDQWRVSPKPSENSPAPWLYTRSRSSKSVPGKSPAVSCSSQK